MLETHLAHKGAFSEPQALHGKKHGDTPLFRKISDQHTTVPYTTTGHEWLVASSCPTHCCLRAELIEITLWSFWLLILQQCCLFGVEQWGRKAAAKHMLCLCVWLQHLWNCGLSRNCVSTAAQSLCIAIKYLPSSTKASESCPRFQYLWRGVEQYHVLPSYSRIILERTKFSYHVNCCLTGNQPSDRGVAKASDSKRICVWAQTHQHFTVDIQQFLLGFSSSSHNTTLWLSATY